MERIKRFLADDSGATAMEYVLVVSLIAVILATAIVFWGFAIERSLESPKPHFTTEKG